MNSLDDPKQDTDHVKDNFLFFIIIFRRSKEIFIYSKS